MEQTELKDRIVVITGASSGFGKGAALAFSRAGASLVLAARRSELIDELAEECERANGRALAVPTDVSRWEEMEELARAAIDVFGRIDVWVNNAGVGAIGPFQRIPVREHRQVIETNLIGTLYGSYLAYREFLARGRGVLINIASELGRHTVPYYASYVAAKHGVVGLGESLQQEIEQQNLHDIHVCTVLPTAHDTPFFDHVSNHTGREVRPPRPLHDPMKVVNRIVDLAADPRDDTVVGYDGIAKILLKRIAPGIADRIAGHSMHKTQMEQAPPAAESSGAVRSPMPDGAFVDAGRR